MMFREKRFNSSTVSYFSWFSCGSPILIELEFGSVGFSGGKKTGKTGEKPSEQGKNQQQTQPTYDTGAKSHQGHIGGEAMPQPCSPKYSFYYLSYDVAELLLLFLLRNFLMKSQIPVTLTTALQRTVDHEYHLLYKSILFPSCSFLATNNTNSNNS